MVAFNSILLIDSFTLYDSIQVQVDGAATTSSDRILVIGATNTPWDLDEAVLRSSHVYMYNKQKRKKKTFYSCLNFFFSGGCPKEFTFHYQMKKAEYH
jgi:hypothetical protein